MVGAAPKQYETRVSHDRGGMERLPSESELTSTDRRERHRVDRTNQQQRRFLTSPDLVIRWGWMKAGHRDTLCPVTAAIKSPYCHHQRSTLRRP